MAAAARSGPPEMASNSSISLGLLVRLSLRSIFAHRIKLLIVGSLLSFGTFLLVFGTTLLANVERAMETSVTGSLTGHIQLVSLDGTDQLAFTGPDAGSDQDLGVIESFPKVKEAALSIPNVKAVVPMGRHVTIPLLGNELDDAIQELRDAVDAGDPALTARLVRKSKRAIGLILDDYRRRLTLLSNSEEIEEAILDLEKAGSDELWARLETEPAEVFEFLETRVAKLGEGPSHAFIPFIGTDLDAFAESFETFTLVEGEMVPKGHRGFLFNKTYYEDVFKNRIARGIDKLHEARSLDGRLIDRDPALQLQVKQLAKFTSFVTRQLDPDDAVELERKLDELLPGTEGDLDRKMVALLELNDENFDRRRTFFYEEIAPKIRLYSVKVGDHFTLRSSTKAGYPKSINIKVYGTFQFAGLERSAIASAYSIMDLMSFRDLYGLMTVEKREELDSIRAEVGVAELSRDEVEDALFGDVDDAEEEAAEGDRFAAFQLPDVESDAAPGADAGAGGPIDIAERVAAIAGSEAAAQESQQETFTQEELERGTVIHAAVVLEDPSGLSQAIERLNELSAERDLGFKAVAWSEVTGIIGQLIVVVGAVLYITIAIIFLVALVIINNSMVMATMDRVSEIGTMRAIGAGRRFVLALFLVETLVLGGIASGLGAGAATALTLFLGNVGIPASSNDFLIFLFGGPALYPEVGLLQIGIGLFAIFVVSLLSTLYPARLAARIEPVVAMQAKE